MYYEKCDLPFRPMYVDSSDETEPSGLIPVSKLLIQHIEPLLVVRSVFITNYSSMCRSIVRMILKVFGTHSVDLQGGHCVLGSSPHLSAYVSSGRWRLSGRSTSARCHGNGRQGSSSRSQVGDSFS